MSRRPPRRTCASPTSSRRTCRRTTCRARGGWRSSPGRRCSSTQSAPVVFPHVGAGRRRGARAGQRPGHRAAHARPHAGQHLPRRHRPDARARAVVRAHRRYALRGRRRPAGPARARARRRPAPSSSTTASTGALLTAARPHRGLPGALRRLRLWQGAERQARVHDRLRAAVQPGAAVAVEGRVRRASSSPSCRRSRRPSPRIAASNLGQA